jgi:signal transduction histidine kinase
MKKTGRIVGVCFTTVVGACFFLYYYFIIRGAWEGQAVGAVFCSVIAWWLGSFYDKSRFYAKELENKTIELENSREDLKNYFNSENITIWEYEIFSKALIFSLGANRILRYSPVHNESPGVWADSDFIYNDDKERLRQYVNDFLSGKQAKLQYRIIHPSSNEEIRWVESCASPVYKNGKLVKVIGSLTDITEEKLNEEILRRSDKLHAIGELASGVAHEIRNPLTTIQGFMQLIKPKLQEKHYVDIVLKEIDRINQIVSEFLVLSKPYAANYYRKNIMNLIQDTVSFLEPQLHLYAVQIIIKEEITEPPFVYCEENQIKQVFINILKNAIEAMPKGGEISILTKRVDMNISIYIIDQGIGIERDKLSKIGTPFHTTKENGTGLGLMVSSRIIQKHNGSLTINSEINKGTTVMITLPLHSPEEEK